MACKTSASTRSASSYLEREKKPRYVSGHKLLTVVYEISRDMVLFGSVTVETLKTALSVGLDSSFGFWLFESLRVMTSFLVLDMMELEQYFFGLVVDGIVSSTTRARGFG